MARLPGLDDAELEALIAEAGEDPGHHYATATANQTDITTETGQQYDK